MTPQAPTLYACTLPNRAPDTGLPARYAGRVKPLLFACPGDVNNAVYGWEGYSDGSIKGDEYIRPAWDNYHAIGLAALKLGAPLFFDAESELQTDLGLYLYDRAKFDARLELQRSILSFLRGEFPQLRLGMAYALFVTAGMNDAQMADPATAAAYAACLDTEE